LLATQPLSEGQSSNRYWIATAAAFGTVSQWSGSDAASARW
jgi:hypothetical protein